jgi:mono/diheme cytochrome c family protein
MARATARLAFIVRRANPKERSMTKRLLKGAVLLGATLLAVPVAAHAQGADIGKTEYNNSCAVCHGTGGTGNGPLAKALKPKVADLTTLRKRNGGVFPFKRVYDIISGSKMVSGHGTRFMPAWGQIYNDTAPQSGADAAQGDDRSYVRGRILALIGYLDSLQVK